MDQHLEDPDMFSPQKVRESDRYKINMSTLKEPRLAENRLFLNLVNRLEAFYVLTEKYRK